MSYFRIFLVFCIMLIISGCVVDKTVYNSVIGKKVSIIGDINNPVETRKIYLNTKYKYKVLGEFISGVHKGKITFGFSNYSLDEAISVLHTTSCKNYFCKVIDIQNEKASFSQQSEIFVKQYGLAEYNKYFTKIAQTLTLKIENTKLKILSKSDIEICNAIEEKIPLWGLYENEEKKRNLDCSKINILNSDKATSPIIQKPFFSNKDLQEEKNKRLLEVRKRKALEKEIAELKKKNKELQNSKKKQPSKSKGRSGSGFFISKLGHIITNEHVVQNCNKITVGDNIDRQVSARLIEVDKKNDLALLKTTTLDLASSETKLLIKKLSTQKLGIEIVPLATAGLMRSDDVELGEKIVVAGFPYGEIFSKEIKVTFGNVNSTKGIGDDSSQFQIQAPVQIGNSGGPIYDKYGNIVGVVVAQLDKLKMATTIGSLPENVNFGIKASTVKQFLNSSGLPTKWAARNKEMSNKEISQIASKQTVMVVCHRD